jgi:hypothetical protein
MIFETIGAGLVITSLGLYAYSKRPMQMKIRQAIKSVIVKREVCHMCSAERKVMKIYPSVEYVIPKYYGYRVLVHLPNDLKLEHFLARQEIFEDKVGYPIVMNVEGDVLFMDVVTTKDEVILPSRNVIELTRDSSNRIQNTFGARM